MVFKTTSLALFLLALSSNVTAAVISYDETLHGDIAGHWPWDPEYLGTTDIGTNTISGTVGWDVSLNVTEFDTFSFTVPSGQQVTSIITDYVADPMRVLGALVNMSGDYSEPYLFDFSMGQFEHAPLPGDSLAQDISSGTDILALAGIEFLGAGDYKIETGSIESYAPESSLDYTWTMEVTAVPIPASVWLFGSGLIGLIGFARRKIPL